MRWVAGGIYALIVAAAFAWGGPAKGVQVLVIVGLFTAMLWNAGRAGEAPRTFARWLYRQRRPSGAS